MIAVASIEVTIAMGGKFEFTLDLLRLGHAKMLGCVGYRNHEQSPSTVRRGSSARRGSSRDDRKCGATSGASFPV